MDFKDKKDDGILEKLVHINRITKVVKGGRRFGFSALVVVGNQAGKIGVAHAKAKQVPDAIKKAMPLLLENQIEISCILREWDKEIWPFANKGFFKVKKKIPKILQNLNIGSP